MNWNFVVGYILGTIVTLALKAWRNEEKEEEGKEKE